MIGDNELEQMWKQAVTHNLQYYPNTFLEGVRKTMKISERIANM
jgi:hypothetical protein